MRCALKMYNMVIVKTIKMIPLCMVLFLLMLIIGKASALTCYDYQCTGDTCFNHGGTCNTSIGSCQTQRIGNVVMFYCFDMSGIKCTSRASNTSGTLSTTECCDTDLCNDGVTRPPFETGQKYCYSATCDTEGCLDGLINYISSNQIGAFCKADENGCQISKQTYQANGKTIIQELIGCAEFKCSGTSQISKDIKTDMSCCKEHLCTQGSPFETGQKYCYSAMCDTEGCLDGMINYISSNQIGAYCKADENGCQINKHTFQVDGKTVIQETIGCAMTTCLSTTQTLQDRKTDMGCCKEHLCTEAKETDPGEASCYEYHCSSINSSVPCMSLRDAIAQKKTGYCKMTDKGCFTTSAVGKGISTIASGCAEISQGFDKCWPASVVNDAARTSTLCCTSHQCNDGTGGDALDPNKKYCHVYTCRTTSPGTSCLSLTEAIKQNMTTVCEMNDWGCLYSKFRDSNATGVLSDCNRSGQVPCIPLGTLNSDRAVLCCKENKCNPEIMGTSAASVTDKPRVKYLYLILGIFYVIMKLDEEI